MKVYLINLDKDTARLVSADAQLKRLGVEYERVPAVYAKAMPEIEKRKVLNRFRWWCAVGRPATDGEIGCAMSHAEIYRKMVGEGIPSACILEDDVVLGDRFPMILNDLESRVDFDKAAVYLLSNHSESEGQIGERETGFRSDSSMREMVLHKVSGDFCAECYVLGKSTAEKLLEVNAPLITPCDWWGRWRRLGIIELYHVFPTVAGQRKGIYESNTLPGIMEDVCKLPLSRYVWHKMKRVFGVTVDRIYCKISSCCVG